MSISITVIIVGLVLLVWSADRFVQGASSTARHFGLSPLLIGMVIVGFGTSAPEMLVSVMAAIEKNPGIAIGNAYGSNITNIGLILGVSAMISPLAFHSGIIRKELPILALVTGLAALQVWDGMLSRLDAGVLVVAFVALMGWTIRKGLRRPMDKLGEEMQQHLSVDPQPLKKSILWMVVGLVILVASSRMLVWGAVNVARGFGVDDLIIGLTIVAVGTSMPELASSVMAARRNEHDIALGNILGSNLFNTLAVVGIAGSIRPFSVPPEVFTRDILVMGILTLSLFGMGYGVKRQGRINRLEGATLFLAFGAYTGWLVVNAAS